MTKRMTAPAQEACWRDYHDWFENYLRGLVFSTEYRLTKFADAMNYSLFLDDARLRPTLCMETARTFGCDPIRVLPSATAIELVHAYALVHAELPAVENSISRNRRGSSDARKGTHTRYGEAIAILVGDAFFGEAMKIVATRQEGRREHVVLVLRELAAATGANGMVGGQALETTLHWDSSETSLNEILEIHDRKTGTLVQASARIGAILAGAGEKERQVVSAYARDLGLRHRILQDLHTVKLRCRSGEEIPIQIVPDEVPFVSLYGMRGASRAAEEAADRAIAALSGIDADTEGLQDMVLAAGVC